MEQTACDRCEEPLELGAAYCDNCGERTRRARRIVRLSIRIEFLFLALMAGLVVAFVVFYGR